MGLRSAVLVSALLVAPGAEPGFTGKVVGVSDGDTLTVLDGRTQVKVRLHGVDCPESGQAYGSRAKQAASALAFGKAVTVRPVARDRYGRRRLGRAARRDGRKMPRKPE